MKRSPLQWILRKIKKRIPAVLLMTLCHVGSALLGVAFALMCKNVIDFALQKEQQSFYRACVLQAVIILGMLVCMVVFRSLRDRLSADLDRDLKTVLFHHLLNGDYTAVTGYHTGELINRMNNDVRTVGEGILNILPNVASMAAKLIAAVSALATLEPLFTLVVVAAGAVVLAGTSLVRGRLKHLHKRVSEEDGKVSGFMQETLEKLLMVQALDVADELEARADVLLNRRYKAQMLRKNVSLAANTGISFLSHAAGFIALIWCAFGLFTGQLSVGTLTAVTQLVNQLQRPFVGMSGVLPQYMAILASAERLMELEEIQPTLSLPENDKPIPCGDISAIGVQNLHFSYESDVIFNGADFELPKGAFAAITGPSGIGKSTLLKLMLGIVRPDEGEVYVVADGERLRVDKNTRNLFTYVPQGNLLLSGSLRDNLTIVKPEATDKEILLAAHISGLDEFLSQLPNGLDTPVGENGAGLSEGQLQRLAIARAVLSGAPVLLLDECTSALDNETEVTVLNRLRSLPGRTCLAVTHRPATRELCDVLLEVSEGKISAALQNHNKFQ